MSGGTRMRFDERMSEPEGLMWRLDKDPHLMSNFGTVSVLDRPADAERFRRRMARAVAVLPRLRQRVQTSPVNLSPPAWVDDEGFDLDYHLRRIALPAPGTTRQLLDLASLVVADPFDRTRPLWEFVLVEGLEGGRGALIQKFHHTVIDGEAGVRVAMEFVDVERHAPEPPPLEPAPKPRQPPTQTDRGEVLRTVAAMTLLAPAVMARQMREVMADPRRLPDTGAAAVTTLRAVLTELSATDRARSPVWAQRSLQRRLEVLRVPIDDVKAAAATLGGTLNTAFLAGAAAAAGEYHRQVGHPVDELRATMAISTRTRESGSNAFSLARVLVPTSEMAPAERFAAITAAAVRARADSATASLQSVASLATLLPTNVVTRLARQQAQTVDFATSNVRAAPFPCFIAGGRITENYPIGPTAGVAFNLTLLSYDGSLDMAANIDTAAVAEPERLRECLSTAFHDLVAAGGVRRAANRSTPKKAAKRTSA